MESDIFPVDLSASAAVASQSDSVHVNGASRLDVGLTTTTLTGSEREDIDSYNPIEPPPLDWRSDSSSEAGSADDLDDPSLPPPADSLDMASLGESVLQSWDARDILTPFDTNQQVHLRNVAEPVQNIEEKLEEDDEAVEEEVEVRSESVEGDQEVLTF